MAIYPDYTGKAVLGSVRRDKKSAVSSQQSALKKGCKTSQERLPE
jgi:hypothetical protein